MNAKTSQLSWVCRAFVLLLTTFAFANLSAQTQVWPGDINDNGIVNNIDLLYWGVAEGDKGPKRSERGTNWIAYDTAIDWDDDFLAGLNYSQADADGRGKIETSDRNAILEDNYGQTHGTLTPDVFLTGNPNVDPILWLEAQDADVNPGETVTFDVFFGDATHPVDHYFGVAFTISWNPDYVASETSAPWTPTVADFDLNYGTWLNDAGESSSNSYVYLKEATGELDVVLLRKKLGQNSGHGEIASFNVILEDIVFLNDENTVFTIDKIKLIDENMIEYPVASSTEYITIRSNAQSLVGQEEEASEAATTVEPKTEEGEAASNSKPAVPQPIVAEEVMRVKLFPNPSANWLQIDCDRETTIVEHINIYNQQGVLVLQQAAEQSSQQLINIVTLPTGNYYLHVITNSGKSILQFHKTVD